MSSSEEHDLDLSFEEVVVSRINSLERFATEQISGAKKTHTDLQESLKNTTIISDMAAVKAELSALKTRVADQDRQTRQAAHLPTLKSRRRDRLLHRIGLQNRRREVTSHDTNNNNLVMFLSDGRNLELNAAAVHSEGVSRGVWDASKRAS